MQRTFIHSSQYQTNITHISKVCVLVVSCFKKFDLFTFYFKDNCFFFSFIVFPLFQNFKLIFVGNSMNIVFITRLILYLFCKFYVGLFSFNFKVLIYL